MTCLVVGGGVTGLVAALAIAQTGVPATLVGQGLAAGADDGRTAALLLPSVRLLEGLGVWEPARLEAAALRSLRIVHAPDGRAQADVTFTAREIGEEAFGWNVANARLRGLLLERAAELGVALVEGEAVRARNGTLELADGRRLEAALVVAADGKRSRLRAAAGIGARRHVYGLTALVTSFAHERPHGDCSIELHGAGGTFTMVPLPGRRSSLVWVEPDATATRLMALPEADFAGELAGRAGPWLGGIAEIRPRHAFRLEGMLADRLVAPRLVLIGEAAHALSPIGAQGLNLSLRDVGALAAEIGSTASRPGQLGSPAMLQRYARARWVDLQTRFWTTDGLSRFVTSPLTAPLRALGLRGAGAFWPVRQILMRGLLEPAPSPFG